MLSPEAPARRPLRGLVLVALALALPWFFPGPAAEGTQKKPKVLLIGASGSLTSEKKDQKEESALKTLKEFIKEETGMNNDILSQKDWRELTDKVVKGQLHLGVYQGYEFAWAQEKNPQLKPLALAVNVYQYPTGYVVVKKDNKAKDFAGLQGQSLSLPTTGPRFLRLWLEHEAQRAGKKLEEFFSKVDTPENIEDALDDVVDGKVQAVAADRAALEGFKRRKPGRFAKLKEVAQSQKFPPPLVAYYDAVLDKSSLGTFRKGLLGAKRKERGQTMLTLFRLTEFTTVPADFEKVLTATRKNYPPSS
jgi:ABC-type phosphate/phosphonate transport system substrate-binding protein